MEKLTKDAEKIVIERFGNDSIIALATTADETPYVRNVNTCILRVDLTDGLLLSHGARYEINFLNDAGC